MRRCPPPPCVVGLFHSSAGFSASGSAGFSTGAGFAAWVAAGFSTGAGFADGVAAGFAWIAFFADFFPMLINSACVFV